MYFCFECFDCLYKNVMGTSAYRILMNEGGHFSLNVDVSFDLQVVSLSREWVEFSLGEAEAAVHYFFFRIDTLKGS